MTFDIKPLLAGKKALRKRLMDLPVKEKIALLDLLRERAIAIRDAAEHLHASGVQEMQKPYGTEKK